MFELENWLKFSTNSMKHFESATPSSGMDHLEEQMQVSESIEFVSSFAVNTVYG